MAIINYSARLTAHKCRVFALDLKHYKLYCLQVTIHLADVSFFKIKSILTIGERHFIAETLYGLIICETKGRIWLSRNQVLKQQTMAVVDPIQESCNQSHSRNYFFIQSRLRDSPFLVVKIEYKMAPPKKQTVQKQSTLHSFFGIPAKKPVEKVEVTESLAVTEVSVDMEVDETSDIEIPPPSPVTEVLYYYYFFAC